MNLVRTFLAYLEYLFIRFLSALYALVPAHQAYALGAGITSLAYPLFRKRRRLAIDNILKAHITDDPRHADQIARKAFGHLAGHLCEALKVNRIVTAENWPSHISFDGPEASWKLLMETPDVPIMILTAHLGAWEAAVPIISRSRPLIAVARTMNNPFAESFLKRNHFRGTITIISKKKGFTPRVLRQWKQERAAMTLVMDQHASPKQGVIVNSLGRPASAHTSPARIHLQSGAPILAGAFIRDRAFHYRMVTGMPIQFSPTDNREADVKALTTEISSRLDDIIRRYPEQYLWAHNRWRI